MPINRLRQLPTPTHACALLYLPPAAQSNAAAAMNRYAHLTEQQKQDILNKAHNVRSEMEMYTLVADLANGWVQ